MTPSPPDPRIRRGCPGADRTPLAGPESIRPALFLDRDGVINLDRHYVHRVEDFEWVPGVHRAVEMAKEAGMWVVVVTNQSGIERGFYTEPEYLALTRWLVARLPVDLVVHCPHLTGCPARKPGVGMLEAAAEILPIRREGSLLIGDKATDLQAATAFGIPGHLFGPNSGPLDGFLHGLIPQP